ncbi:MAG: choice-of-anchor J domain-containing protein [Bacteroidia bacterium]|nr:choice-of-anchor J domain-containing protein [Bacteroidia bacterium]
MRSKNYTSARLLQRMTMAIALVALLGTRLSAQSFTENFNNVANLFTSGWAQQNLSTPVGTVPGWFQGNVTVFTAYNAPDTSYIGANYNNVSGANTISNWLFTPTRTFQNGDVISFWSRTVDAPSFPDRLEVRLSTNGASVNVGTTATSVGDYTTLLLTINSGLTTTGYPNVWTQYTITISGLGAPTSGRVAFRYFVTNGGPSGANSDFIGIDNYVYTQPVAADLEMQIADTLEYTITPIDHQWPGPFTGTIRNNGTTSISNAAMKVNVYDGLGTQVYTQTSTLTTTLAPGATAAKTVPGFTATSADFYTYEYICTHSVADGNTANDTLYNGVLVDNTTYARDNGNVIGALGIGAGNGGYLGNQYHLYQADNLDSILVFVTAGYTGEPMAAVIWDMASGQPNTIIGSTDTLTYSTDAAATYVLPIHNGPLALAAGDYAVTFVEFDSTVQLGQTADIFRNGTTWVNWPTSPAGGWANNEFFGVSSFNRPYVIRPILSACPVYTANMSSTQSACGATTGTATINVAGGPFTYLWSNGNTNATATNLGAGNYTVTATDGNGCSVVGTTTVTNPNAPTATPTTTPALCNGGNGSVAAGATGGTAPYTYVWSNGGSTAIINAPAGAYSVTVTDAAGCAVTAGPATVTQPTAVTSTATSTPESAPGANDGSATVVANGGTPPYSYTWSNGGTTATISNIGSGALTVTVTDGNGCTSTASVNVVVGIDGAMNAMEYGAYPNPNEGTFKVFINTTEPTDVSMQIVDLMGKMVFEAGALSSTEFIRDVNLSNQAAGFYFVRVKAAGVTRTIKIEVKH